MWIVLSLTITYHTHSLSFQIIAPLQLISTFREYSSIAFWITLPHLILSQTCEGKKIPCKFCDFKATTSSNTHVKLQCEVDWQRKLIDEKSWLAKKGFRKRKIIEKKSIERESWLKKKIYKIFIHLHYLVRQVSSPYYTFNF